MKALLREVSEAGIHQRGFSAAHAALPSQVRCMPESFQVYGVLLLSRGEEIGDRQI